MRQWFIVSFCSLFYVNSFVLAAQAKRTVQSSLLPSRVWKLAFVRGDDIWIANGDGTDQHRIIEHGDAPAWSPDKKQLAFARDGNVWMAEADGTEQRQVVYLPKVGASKTEFSPPNGRAIDISWDRVRNFLTFSRHEVFWIGRNSAADGAWRWGAVIYQVPLHPQPPHLVLSTLWDYTDNGAEYTFTYHAHPAWAPDGVHLIFVRDGDIWLGTRKREEVAEPEWSRRWDWEVTRIASVARFDAPTGRASRENDGVTHFSWSPDGVQVAYGIQRMSGSGTTEIHLLNLHTGKQKLLTNDGIEPCFSPDGKWIAYFAIGENYGIYAMTSDGKIDKLVVENGEQPAW